MPNNHDSLIRSRVRINVPTRVPLRSPDSPDNEIIFVTDGVLALYIMDARGSRQIVGLRFPGEMIIPGSRGRAGVWPLTKAEVLIADATDAIHDGEGVDMVAQQRRDGLIAQEWLAQARAGRPVSAWRICSARSRCAAASARTVCRTCSRKCSWPT
jgi:hypothetical protein